MATAMAAPEAEVPPELCKLPRGRHGLPREFIALNQRTRLVSGMVETVNEFGYAGASVSRCCEAARVSRASFYEYFPGGREQCFAAAYEVAIGELRRRFVAAVAAGGEWPRSAEAGLAAMLEFLADNPHIARLTMVEVLLSTPEMTRRHHEEIGSLAPYLTPEGPVEGAADGQGAIDGEAAGAIHGESAGAIQGGPAGAIQGGPAGAIQGEPAGAIQGEPSELTAEVILAGVFSLISGRVLAGRSESLPELLPRLSALISAPYR